MTSGVLMLVRSNRTNREQVKRATSTANAVGATVLGVILNAVPTSGPDAYAYGYGYGYGYGRKGKAAQVSRDENTAKRNAGQSTRTWTRQRGRPEGFRRTVARPAVDPSSQRVAVDVLPHLEERQPEASPEQPPREQGSRRQ